MAYKISVIIPTYNAEEYLLEAVESVKNQTIGFENIELILVDDNSNDNTKTILNTLSKDYENIKAFFLKENTGSASEPRNFGIKESASDYIMFLDSDDTYLPNMCEVMYSTIIKYDGEMVSCRFKQMINGKSKIPYYFFEDFKPEKFNNFKGKFEDDTIFIDSIKDFPELLNLGCHSMAWNKIFKKESIVKNQIKFPKGAYYEDVYFTSDFILKSKNLVFLTSYFGYSYNIRQDENASVCQDFSQKMVEKQLKGFLATMELIKEKNNLDRYKSELIVDMVKIYIYSNNLEKTFEEKFLRIMRDYFKNYSLFEKIHTTSLQFNIIINIFIKLFSFSNKIASLVSKLYTKIKD